jgi:putative protease
MTTAPSPLELLSPAKDLTCGIEAINHGADAVYIGAPRFSARAAAGNSISDISRLCDYAHTYGARVYVALNTILTDAELPEAEHIINQLYNNGADALIIQDMGITKLNIPPIALHASTQADIRTPDKARFLESNGFSQIVLARELTLKQIREIAQSTSLTLEAFIHGALCVSFSGQCYISQALAGRSANRGECAQYCRLPYTMTDAEGQIIARDKHLLSLRDLNRSSHIEALLDAGITSFKIEGRLKDLSYVKNITAWYRRLLDNIIARHTPNYKRASAGTTTTTFAPSPEKSFNRGFTPYFLHGRTANITSFDTPKSIGEPIGSVKKLHPGSFTFIATQPLHNGDGLAFFTPAGLSGFRLNKVEGHRAWPQKMPSDLSPGTTLYRNYDHEFEKQLAKPSAQRKISVNLILADTPTGFTLTLTDETGTEASISIPHPKATALTNQDENIRRQLSKLGPTPFIVNQIDIQTNTNNFIPSSLLSEMRRQAISLLIENRKAQHLTNRTIRTNPTPAPPAPTAGFTLVPWQWNVANHQAQTFYREHGATDIENAFELSPRKNVPLMYTKHCLRYSLGWCPHTSAHKEPYYLLHKNIKLRLEFDCRNCQMLIYAT